MANLHVNQRDEFKRTPLHYNVYENRLNDVKNLLLQGADASLTSNKDNTPLHTAASRKLPLMVEVLLKYSPRDKVKKFINVRTSESQNTALHVAASNGCVQSVRYLLSYGANFEVKNKAGKRAIDLANDAATKKLLVNVEFDSKLAAQGKYRMLHLRLLGYTKEDLTASVFARNNDGMTSLQLAVINNHCNTVQSICEVRVDRLQQSYAANKNAKTEEFIELGKKAADGQSALMLHSQDPNTMGAETMVDEVAEILAAAHKIVKLGEKAFKKDDGEPYEQPMLLAIVEETLEALEFKPGHVTYDKKGRIVFRGQKARYYKMLCVPPADVNEDYDDFDDEAKIISYMGTLQIAITRALAMFMRSIFTIQLSLAAEENNFDIFEQCVDAQFVDVNVTSQLKDNRTPLHHAAGHGNASMVEILIEKKANITALTMSKKETPLHLAAANGHTEVIELLLQSLQGEDLKRYVDMKTHKEGRTALLLAAANGHLKAMLRLMSFYSTYDVKGKDGKMPKDLFAQDFFKIVEEMFTMAREGDAKLPQRLEQMQSDQLLAVGNTRNNTGLTIDKVADKKGHRALANKIAKIVKDNTLPPKPKKTGREQQAFDEHYREIELYQLMDTLAKSST